MDKAEKILGELLKTEISIREVRAGAWVAVPNDRRLLQSKTWMALRQGPKSGVGHCLSEAAVLLAIAYGRSKPRLKAPRHTAKAWLAEFMAGRSEVSVDQVKSYACSLGLSWSALDRAARDLGVERRKTGFSGGWIWTMNRSKPV